MALSAFCYHHPCPPRASGKPCAFRLNGRRCNKPWVLSKFGSAFTEVSEPFPQEFAGPTTAPDLGVYGQTTAPRPRSTNALHPAASAPPCMKLGQQRTASTRTASWFVFGGVAATASTSSLTHTHTPACREFLHRKDCPFPIHSSRAEFFPPPRQPSR